MDMEKLKQWLDLTKNMHGGDFWNNIFEQDFAKQFTNEEQSHQDQRSHKERTTKSYPAFELLEGEQDVMIILDLSGVLKENIELGINGNVLTIKGRVLPIYPQLKVTYSERFLGEFQRQIPLPDTVNPKQLTAKFWHGLLLISYQRTIEQGERIPID